MKKWKIAWWDVLIIGGAILILGWAMLKSLGIIYSPTWIEMIPYLGGGASIIGVAYKIGKVIEVINGIGRDVSRLLTMETRLNKIEHEHNLAMCGKLKLRH